MTVSRSRKPSASKNVSRKSQKTTTQKQVYELMITLVGSDPAIWRRFQVENSIPLDVLHQVIQIIMGWQDCHVHEFQFDDDIYGPKNVRGLKDVKDERKVPLYKLLKEEGARFRYVYDFGDDWEHEIVLEHILEPARNTKYPLCIDGEGACPPEDCGGIWGYYDMLQAMEDPADPDYEDVVEFLGEEFDPEAFDIRQVNAELKKFQ